MVRGNVPYDNGHLILNNEEKEKLLSNDNRSKKFIKKLVGADEFINGIPRYCLWIRDDQLEEALSIVEIKNRVKKVKEFRLSRKDLGAKKLAKNLTNSENLMRQKNFLF